MGLVCRIEDIPLRSDPTCAPGTSFVAFDDLKSFLPFWALKNISAWVPAYAPLISRVLRVVDAILFIVFGCNYLLWLP